MFKLHRIKQLRIIVASVSHFCNIIICIIYDLESTKLFTTHFVQAHSKLKTNHSLVGTFNYKKIQAQHLYVSNSRSRIILTEEEKMLYQILQQ